MTTLIQNEQKRQKIMARMREHLVPVLEHCRGGWVGLFLQGSQNYNLDYEGSDIDTKAIMLPSFSDFVLNAKPLSTTHIMENNEHVDFKDIRLMFDCIKKQNVNFVEILFTPYSIINPEYADLFQPVLDAREEIARYNNYAGMNCIMGMALEKQKAMEHPYPATMDKIEAFGYDPKQLHHALRLREFMTRYEAGEPYLLQRIQHYLSVRATSSSTEVFSSHLCMYAPCHRRSDQQTALNFLLCHKILEH